MRRRRESQLLNIEQTAINADNILSQYQHKKDLLQRWNFGIQSPSFETVTQNDHSKNHVEDRLVSHIDEKTFCGWCEQIINEMINDKQHAQILKYTYLTPLDSDQEIMERLHYERSSYYRHRKLALCDFAEFWPPVVQELVVYNEQVKQI